MHGKQDAASLSTRITTHRDPHPIYHPYTTPSPSSTGLYYSYKSRPCSFWHCNGSENQGKYLLAPRLVYAFCIYFSRFAFTPSNIAEISGNGIYFNKIWRACAFFFFTFIINSFSATTKFAHFLATNYCIEICFEIFQISLPEPMDRFSIGHVFPVQFFERKGK